MLHPVTAVVISLSLLLYGILGYNVGRARGKYRIAAPATTGHPDFERVFRVHQNTLESLAVFVPSLWIFSQFVSALWGAALGAVWITGRTLYAIRYYQAAAKRGPGFGIAAVASMVLLIGGFTASAVALMHSGTP